MRPPIYFLIPRQHWPPGGLPQTVEALWPWLVSRGKRGVGPWVWTLQTYLHLRTSGVECELADALPRKGIVVSHRDFLPEESRPGRELFLVCILADREAPTPWGSGRHPYAQLHVVQNPKDPLLTHAHKLWKGYYLPFWPQPGLLPRAAARGDRFEHAAFVGSNPAPEFSTSRWKTGLKELGLSWDVMPVERWHDYRQIDVVAAVRSFGRSGDYPYKPASKLWNAWHAGVPALLGPEAAYRCERKNELDYLEITSIDDALRAVQRLRDDPELRHAMVANGTRRALELTPAKITALWATFLDETVCPTYARWEGRGEASRILWCAGRFLARYHRDALVRRGRRWRHRLAKVVRAARGSAGQKLRKLSHHWSETRGL
jgi:hypothetical protein